VNTEAAQRKLASIFFPCEKPIHKKQSKNRKRKNNNEQKTSKQTATQKQQQNTHNTRHNFFRSEAPKKF
jgi:hypothetical protein